MIRALLLALLLGIQPDGAPPEALIQAAREQIGVTLIYDGRYQRLRYPGGDVPMDRGVCTDVLIRAYRKLGIDLQQRVHQDMTAHWDTYPNAWKLPRPDPNIDHRRVPNLAVFFRRQGQELPSTHVPEAYRPGDIVTWRLPQGLPHIGLVSDRRTSKGVPLILHNIGQGTQEEDGLFAFPITGHFRYFPD